MLCAVRCAVQCTEIELMRIQFRTHHESASGKTHDVISTEGLGLLRDRIRNNGQMDAM
jgi:hypothetical protein